MFACGFWVCHNRAMSHSSRFISLSDGPCELVKVVDPATYQLRVMADGRPHQILFRLGEIELIENSSDPSHVRAMSFTRRFLNSGQLQLRFDRQRYDKSNLVLGYLYVDGRMINIAMVENGFAVPAPVPGNSVSIQRRIRQAAEQHVAIR